MRVGIRAAWRASVVNYVIDADRLVLCSGEQIGDALLHGAHIVRAYAPTFVA